MKPHKRLERYLSAIFSLGRIKGMAKETARSLHELRPRADQLERRASQHDEELRAMQKSLDACFAQLSERSEEQKLPKNLAETLVADYRRERDILEHAGRSDTALLARMFSDLSRRLDNIGRDNKGPDNKGTSPSLPASAPETPLELPRTEGFDLFKETFYHRLENRYRGAREEIAKRLKVYLPDVEAAWLRTGKKPAMDLGCGRGEWLEMLANHDIEAFGIDTNAVQIEEAKERGFDVRVGDALQALSEMEDNSLSVLTAHHLIEHLPFDAVAWITREALRVLAPGGLLLFETPNTRNVLVGATTFHTDPTHLKPMPEQVMSVLLETAGFEPVETYGLNPHERFNEFLSKPDFNDELAFLMFGPQDLAILGIKPKEA